MFRCVCENGSLQKGYKVRANPINCKYGSFQKRNNYRQQTVRQNHKRIYASVMQEIKDSIIKENDASL